MRGNGRRRRNHKAKFLHHELSDVASVQLRRPKSHEGNRRADSLCERRIRRRADAERRAVGESRRVDNERRGNDALDVVLLEPLGIFRTTTQRVSFHGPVELRLNVDCPLRGVRSHFPHDGACVVGPWSASSRHAGRGRSLGRRDQLLAGSPQSVDKPIGTPHKRRLRNRDARRSQRQQESHVFPVPQCVGSDHGCGRLPNRDQQDQSDGRGSQRHRAWRHKGRCGRQDKRSRHTISVPFETPNGDRPERPVIVRPTLPWRMR